jgi:hypothetical protein
MMRGYYMLAEDFAYKIVDVVENDFTLVITQISTGIQKSSLILNKSLYAYKSAIENLTDAQFFESTCFIKSKDWKKEVSPFPIIPKVTKSNTDSKNKKYKL